MQLRRLSLMQLSRSLLLLGGLVALLWIAGGASREDVQGQVVVRAGAWLIIGAAVLTGPRPNFDTIRPILFMFLAAVSLPLAQLIPLPPACWAGTASRDLLLAPYQPLTWRPWTMVTGATLNALGSLVVPAATLLVLSQASIKDRQSLIYPLLTIVAAAVLFGLLQFSGAELSSGFVNDVRGSVSSIFANRNHFALLVAMGCVVVPVWGFIKRGALGWRAPVAVALVLLFLLTILAIGSRSGLLLVALSLLMSSAIIGGQLKRRLRGSPSWLLPALMLAGLIIVIGFVALSFAADRAVAVDRLLALEASEDLRVRARSTLLEMLKAYLPLGAGLGSFDPIFRLNEPTSLLARQYFNQAHNDYLGIALDAGLPGLILIASAIAWWAYATFKVMRASDCEEVMLARLGSALLLLVFVASATDYPARTPIIMAIIVISGAWLAHGSSVCRRSALPPQASDV